MKDFTTIIAIFAGCGTVLAIAAKFIGALMSRKFATTKDLEGTNKRVVVLEKDSDRYKTLLLPLPGSIDKLNEKSESQGKDIAVLKTEMGFIVEAVKRIDEGVACIKSRK